MDATSGTPATDTPLHEVRETLRSVELPTAAQSPFGPMRKREQPPVKIPGPRLKPPTSQFHPDATEVAEQVASWWQHAEAFANGDAWDQHHAANAFGGAA